MTGAGSIHATCLLIGERAVLIRGASGSGKSTLARGLIDEATLRGDFARLIADDRVALLPRGARLVATPVAPLAGLVEMAGAGIAAIDHEPSGVVDILIDILADMPARFPDDTDQICRLAGVELGRLAVPSRNLTPADVLMRLKALRQRAFCVS